MKYRTDVIYATGDIDWLTGRMAWDYDYFSFDGTKTIFYKSLADAKEKTGLTKVEYLV